MTVTLLPKFSAHQWRTSAVRQDQLGWLDREGHQYSRLPWRLPPSFSGPSRLSGVLISSAPFHSRRSLLWTLFLWVRLDVRSCLLSKAAHGAIWTLNCAPWRDGSIGTVLCKYDTFQPGRGAVRWARLCASCFVHHRLKEKVGFACESRVACWDSKVPWTIMYKHKHCLCSKCCGSYLWWNMYVFPRVRPS